MAYVPPYISTAGLVIPSYADILADMISQYLAVYPAVVYLGTDTAKYQELSIFALKTYDVMLAIQLAYNARGPRTAVGGDLDGLGPLMGGVARKGSSASTAPITLTGSGGVSTTITLGTVTDTQGNVWDLPTPTTIPPSGTIVVIATCQTLGAVQAAIGQINTISGGATAGWTGASNPAVATPGLPVELDSTYRGRMALSVALPSRTTLDGTIARIAAVPNVTRYNTGTATPGGPGTSIENPTGAIDSWGNPAHSISMVVEGGTDLDVATAIFANRGIGPFTNPNAIANPVGTRSIAVLDPSTGVENIIGFQRPAYVPIFATMVIHGLAGYSSAVIADIKAAIVLYLNSLQIGETVTFSSFYSVAQSVMPSLLAPQFSITSLFTGTAAAPTGTVDITLTPYQVAKGVLADVNVTEA